MMTRLRVVTGANFLRAYGGVTYLSRRLVEEGVKVELFAPLPPHLLAETDGYPYPVYGFPSERVARLPKLRGLLFRAWLLTLGLKDRVPWLLSELTFFREAVAVKKRHPDLPLIHYCQELITPEEHPLFSGVRFYERFANVPDLVLDVEPHRAARRRERYGLTKGLEVLPNTIPLSEIPRPAPRGTLSRLAGEGLPEGVPVLVYAGGVHAGVAFDIVVEALTLVEQPVFFLAFCHGSPSSVEILRELVERRLGPERGRVCDAVPRSLLLAALHEADAGLVYYPYSAERSVNQLYAAPTKLFEYLAVGLPVVASANPSIRDVLGEGNLGHCASDDSADSLKKAIEAVVGDRAAGQAMGARGRHAFVEQYCFERVSAPAVDAILRLLATS